MDEWAGLDKCGSLRLLWMIEVNGDESGGGGVAVETARTRRADTPVHTGGRTRLLCEFTSDHLDLLQSIILVMECSVDYSGE